MDEINIITTCFSIVYGLIILSGIQYLLFKNIYRSVNKTFLFYVLLSIVYYFLNLLVVPDFYGFTGGFKVGTDDLKYFTQIKDESVLLKNTLSYGVLSHTHQFSIFLKILYPFPIYSPLQIITFNCLGITLIPILGKRIFDIYFTDEFYKTKILFILLLLCPTLLMNGLILIRDGWTTQFFMIFCYLLLTKRYNFLMFLSAGLLIFLRPSFIVFPFLFAFIELNFHKKFFWSRSIALLLILLPIAAIFLKQIEGVDLSEGVTRDGYVDSFLGKFEDESIFYKIMKLPFPLNILVSYIFFLTSPFLKFRFFYEDTFIIRNVFSILEAVMMIILMPVFFKNLKSNVSNLSFQKLLTFVSVSILVLSTISLQFRHKIILLPFIYMLLVFSFKKSSLNFILITIYLLLQLMIVL